MHGDPPDLVADELALAGVEPISHADTQSLHYVDDGTSTPDPARRAVEGGEEAITCRIHFATPEPLELLAHHGVVALQCVPPRPIAELNRAPGRISDVCEQDSEQDTFRHGLLSDAGEELLDQDQGTDAFGIRCGIEHAHRSRSADTHERGPFRTGGIAHRPNIVHPLLQRRQLGEGDGIREARTPLVEDDQAAERRKPLVIASRHRRVPEELEVGQPVRHEDQIRRAVADDAVGDADAVRVRVSRFGNRSHRLRSLVQTFGWRWALPRLAGGVGG